MGKGKVILKIGFSLLLTLAVISAAAQSRDPAAVGADSLIHQLPGHTTQPIIQGDSKIASLWAGSVRYETIEDQNVKQVEISASLIPSLVRTYLFTISPQMAKGSTGLEPGRLYVMRLVVLRPQIEETSSNDLKSLESRYVAGSEQLVVVDMNRTILTQLNLRFHSFTAMTMQNTLLIQLLPTNLTEKNAVRGKQYGGIDLEKSWDKVRVPPDAYLKSVNLSVKFTPRQYTGFMSAVPKRFENQFSAEDVADLGHLIEAGEKKFRQITQSRMDGQATAKSLKAQYFNLSNPNDIQFFEKARSKVSTLQQMLTDKDETTRKQLSRDQIREICLLLNLNRTDLKQVSSTGIVRGSHGLRTKSEEAWIERSRPPRWNDCELQPENHFAISRSYHIDSLDANGTRALHTYIGRLSLTGNFSMSRSQTSGIQESVQQSANAGVGASFPSPPLTPIDAKASIGLGLSYNYTISSSHGRASLESMVFTSGVDMEAPKWTVNLALKKYETCLYVVTNPKQKMLSGTKLYICSGQTTNTPINVIETLYHIYPAAQSSATASAYDSTSQFVNVLLRGEREYVSLLQSIHSGLKPTQTQESDKGELIRTAIQSVRGMVPPLPGVFSESLDLPSTTVKDPDFWDMFFHRYSESLR